MRGVAVRLRGWVGRRLPWPLELLVIGVGYAAYEGTRMAAPAHRAAAFQHAHDIYAAEVWSHLDVETALNSWLTGHRSMAFAAATWYALAHFTCIIGVLVWLYWRRPEHYGWLRAWLVLTSMGCLVAYWLYPVAPPRFAIPGMTDTLATAPVWGSPAGDSAGHFANLYAAMPSLHVGWALWCAVAVAVAVATRHRRWPLVYPLITIVVVLATANHFLFDAVGGAIALGVGAGLTRLIAGPLRAGRAVPAPAVEPVAVARNAQAAPDPLAPGAGAVAPVPGLVVPAPAASVTRDGMGESARPEVVIVERPDVVLADPAASAEEVPVPRAQTPTGPRSGDVRLTPAPRRRRPPASERCWAPPLP